MRIPRLRGNRYKAAVVAMLSLVFISKPAYAYIDPGFAYVFLQGLLAVALGAGVAWMLGVRRFFANIFRFLTPGRANPAVAEEAAREETEEGDK